MFNFEMDKKNCNCKVLLTMHFRYLISHIAVFSWFPMQRLKTIRRRNKNDIQWWMYISIYFTQLFFYIYNYVELYGKFKEIDC